MSSTASGLLDGRKAGRRTRHARGVVTALALGALAATAWGAGAYQPGTSFTGTSFSASGFIPPDVDGAVGPGHVVELINGRYAVYSRSGAVLQSRSLDSFWNTALAAGGGGSVANYSFDPRILFDSATQRWFAVATDDARSPNSFLVGVSVTADPTQGWKAYKIDSDSNDTHWADFPMLGMDAEGLYIAAHMFPVGLGLTRVTVVALPKADLLQTNPTVANATLFAEQGLGSIGFAPQPVVNQTGGGLPASLLSAIGSGQIERSQILGPIGSPSLNTAGGTIVVPAYSEPPDAPQPLIGSGSPKDDINTGDDRFSSSVLLRDGDFWAVHAVASSGRGAVRWYRIRASDNVVLGTGTITDPNLSLYYPSIAVNGLGDVVIGFSGSSADQPVSAYAVVGKATGGGVTFGNPILLKAGVDDYERLDTSGRNRWGDYSATVADPVNPYAFWTFQEFVSGNDQWSVQVTQIALPQWNVDADGDWQTSGNWVGGVPDAVGAPAGFYRAITAARTLTLNGAVTVGDLAFDSTAGYRLTGGALVLSTTSGSSSLAVVTGSHTIGSPLLLASHLRVDVQGGAGLTLGDVALAGRTLTLAGPGQTGAAHLSGSGAVVVSSGARATVDSVRTDILTIEAGAAIEVRAGLAPTTSVLTLLDMAGAVDAWTGTLDLGTGMLIVRAGSAGQAALQALTSMARSGLNAGGAGIWTGPGISSSAAAAGSDHAVGVIPNSDEFGQVLYPTFGGQPAGFGDVLMRYTFWGDANLDGSVDNLQDYDLWQTGFAGAEAVGGWLYGDFDFNGVVDNLQDYDLWQTGFAAATAGQGVSDAVAAPEPGTGAGLLALLGLLPARRRCGSR